MEIESLVDPPIIPPTSESESESLTALPPFRYINTYNCQVLPSVGAITLVNTTINTDHHSHPYHTSLSVQLMCVCVLSLFSHITQCSAHVCVLSLFSHITQCSAHVCVLYLFSHITQCSAHV